MKISVGKFQVVNGIVYWDVHWGDDTWKVVATTGPDAKLKLFLPLGKDGSVEFVCSDLPSDPALLSRGIMQIISLYYAELKGKIAP